MFDHFIRSIFVSYYFQFQVINQFLRKLLRLYFTSVKACILRCDYGASKPDSTLHESTYSKSLLQRLQSPNIYSPNQDPSRNFKRLVQYELPTILDSFNLFVKVVLTVFLINKQGRSSYISMFYSTFHFFQNFRNTPVHPTEDKSLQNLCKINLIIHL